jgi:DNA-binding transcriptional MerR regulator
MLSIGELALKTGVKVPTIRYYEQMKLIDAPQRSRGNQRRYTHREMEKLSFIKHARDLGFSIEAIRELLDLGAHPEQPCAEADRIAQDHLEQVRLRIAQLQSLEADLERIASGCGRGRVDKCYVIRSLADHALCARPHDAPSALGKGKL